MNLSEKIKSGLREFTSGIKELRDELKFEIYSVKVGFDYHLPERDLDRVLEITQAVKDAKSFVESNNPDVRVFYSCSAGTDPAQHGFSIYGQDTQTVMKAFKEFMQVAGTPDFVRRNLELAERVLAGYHKKLEKRLHGSSIGRYVVAM